MKTLKEIFEALVTGNANKIQNNHYTPIDLGLSVKWASCNVGAKKPEDYGLLFQFGRTDGYAYDSKLGTSFKAKDGLIKIDDIPITTSGKQYNRHDTLDLADDAAHVNMGNKWRMPTKDEIQELLDNTTHKWTKLNGVNGYEFVSKKDETKSIFIPAAGFFDCFNGTFYSSGDGGNIWSSSVNSDSADYAYYLLFDSDFCYDAYSGYRFRGFSVRGVCK